MLPSNLSQTFASGSAASEKTTGLLYDILEINKEMRNQNLTAPFYSLWPLICHMRDLHRLWNSDEWQIDAAEDMKLDATRLLKNKLKKESTCLLQLDCPICDEINSMICVLDEDQYYEGNLVPLRIRCSSCGFDVGGKYQFLAERYVRKQINELGNEIEGFVF